MYQQDPLMGRGTIDLLLCKEALKFVIYKKLVNL